MASPSICFGMVTTARSTAYTVAALDSFFRHTELRSSDRFILIDNDATFSLPARFPRVEIWVNPRPRSFAENINQVLIAADRADADVVFPNNDVIFTPGWLPPLMLRNDAILLPVTNQHEQLAHGALKLKFSMELRDFAGRDGDLSAIVAARRGKLQAGEMARGVLMPFYCFRLPRPIYRAIGLFDEGFGRGGGEDIDYRIRAYLAGFDALLARESFILHFQGKSTWQGGESVGERSAREHEYLTHFRRKWGEELTAVFLGFGRARAFAERLGLAKDVDAGDFKRVIEIALSRRDRIDAASFAPSPS